MQVTIALLLAVALFGGGYFAGHSECAADRVAVKQAAAEQAEQVKAIEYTGEKITKKIEATHETKSADIRRILGPGRVLHPASRSSEASSISSAPGLTHAIPADLGPVAGQCSALESDAAVTTLMLLDLQDWIRQQKDVFDGAAVGESY